MEEMYVWVWVIISVIGIVAVIKVITLIRRNRSLNGSPAAGSLNRQPARIPATGIPNRQAVRTPVTGILNTAPVNAAPAAGIGKTETGPMIYFANNKHGRRDKEYRFNYKKVRGSWRAYILRMPSLGNRDSSGFVTHRLYDNGRPYVCWDRPVNSLKAMQTISRVWADGIQEYIATGKRFG